MYSSSIIARLALGVSLSLVIASCGGGDESATTPAPVDEVATPTTEPEAADADVATTLPVVEEAAPPTDAPTTAPTTTEMPEPAALEPTPTLDVEFDDEPGAEAVALAALFDGERFPDEALDDTENAAAFTELAATSDDAAVVVASLDAMEDLHCWDPDEDCVAIDDRYLAALITRIDPATDPAMLTEALDVARNAFLGDDEVPFVLLDAIVDYGATVGAPNLRAEALNALTWAEWQGRPIAEALVLDSIGSDDPGLKFHAVSGLGSNTDELNRLGEFVGALIEATDDDRYELRASTLSSLMSLVTELPADDPLRSDAFEVAARARLDDEPAVRSRAIRLLGELGSYRAIPLLVADHLDDNVSGSEPYAVTITLADGSEKPVTVNTTGDSVTGDALQAIWSITDRSNIEFEWLAYDWDDALPMAEQIAEIAVPDAIEWYENNRAEIDEEIAAEGGG